MSKPHDEHGGAAPRAHGVQDLMEVRGDLPRLAWVIGARLVACQFAEGRLLVPRDPALEEALSGMGASLHPLRAAFQPDAATAAADAPHRHGRRHVQFHVARMHGDDGSEEEAPDAETGPPAANA